MSHDMQTVDALCSTSRKVGYKPATNFLRVVTCSIFFGSCIRNAQLMLRCETCPKTHEKAPAGRVYGLRFVFSQNAALIIGPLIGSYPKSHTECVSIKIQFILSSLP